MKAISLWQPWASLCVVPSCNHPGFDCAMCELGEAMKIVETRSWKPPRMWIGQRIAIHATVRRTKRAELNAVFDGNVPSWAEDLPLGAVVGTAVLKGVYPMWEWRDADNNVGREVDRGDGRGFVHPVNVSKPWEPEGPRLRIDWNDSRGEILTLQGPEPGLNRVINDQLPFGHFEAGRYGWLLAEPEQFATPIPAVGHQGLWHWDRPVSPPTSTVQSVPNERVLS